MTFSLDTSVVVTATLGGADRLWQRWLNFDKTIESKRFITPAAYEQYELVVEGLGTPDPGIFDESVYDTLRIISRADPSVPDLSHAHALNLDDNRAGRAVRLVQEIQAELGPGGWSRMAAIARLREFEVAFATRRMDFFKRHPVVGPTDRPKADVLCDALLPINRGGGVAWRQACRIAAESSMVGQERGTDVTLVAEGGPLSRNGAAIRSQSGLRDIVDLQMASHCGRP